ncbi:hypothetical protein CP533_5309 [Ophiocordyceps camponoti-saundersi (nom. inval.)]|nr:hypothetical protein CP533_5309 [Ophiocordyceps camponoti-saundersi (nom. inval.)]
MNHPQHQNASNPSQPQPQQQRRQQQQQQQQQQLAISRDGRRPLFNAATSKKMPEPSRQDELPPSPRDTRIPRRRPHKSLTEAFKMAKEEYGIVDGSPSPAPRQWRNSEGAAIIPDLVPGIEDMPLPSIEKPSGASIGNPSGVPIGPPEEGFVWDIEKDFTAGDLQVSDSPRIKVDSSNKPFANRPSLVAGARSTATKATLRPPWGSNFAKPIARRTNSKPDEILAREKQHMSTTTDADRAKLRPKNAKVDEIRQREAKIPSKRAYAAGRLEEIHEQNFDSRSVSPPDANASRTAATTATGERIPNTPVTVFRGTSQDGAAFRRASIDDDANGDDEEDGEDKPRDSRDLLRRLARAASASPGPETEQPQRKPREQGAKPKAVAFKGLRRVDSNESAKSRASMRSEADPTDRIDAEIRLFAPQENHSEQGSVRAPSPPLNDEMATPTQQARDIMLTPKVTGAFIETPATRRRGSDTDDGRPTRARTRDSDTASDPGTSDGHAREAATLKKRRRARSLPRRRPPMKNSAKPPSVREDLLELQRTHNIDDSTLEDVGKSATAAATASTDDSSATLTTKKMKTKTGPEPVAPKPQTQAQTQPPREAKENSEADEGRSVLGRLLLSTLESTKAVRKGIDRLIVASASMTKRVEADGKDEVFGNDKSARAASLKRETRDGDRGDDFDQRPGTGDSTDDKADLMMVPALKGGADEHKSMAVKSEQDNFTLATKVGSYSLNTATDRCPTCQAHLPTQQPTPSSITYLQVPVPRFFQTKPRFRLTLAGLLLFLLSLWLAAESVTCGLYCRPKSCSSASECVFSLDDPHFGTALPAKLDQWTTGGLGGRILATAAEETVDRLADLQDLALGRGILEVAEDQELLVSMSARQKRRLRRRLAKRGVELPSSKSNSNSKPGRKPSAEELAKWEAWGKVRAERKRARRMGGSSGDAGAVGDDERMEE